MTVPSNPSMRRDHSDVRQIGDPVVQTRGDARALRFGDFADLLEIGVRIFGREIEHLLDDARDGFTVAIGNRQQPQVIALAQERIGRRHIAAGDHRSAPDSHEIDDHEHDRKNGQGQQDIHDRPRRQDGFQHTFGGGLRQIRAYVETPWARTGVALASEASSTEKIFMRKGLL